MLPFFFCFIVFSFWLRYELRKDADKLTKSKNTIFDKESQANSTRRKPIDSLHYITISEKSILFREINDSELKKIQNHLLKFTNKTMVDLSNYTNTELKSMYGPANLPDLMEFDQNYSDFIRLLQKFAKALFEKENLDFSKDVLEYSVSIGSDMSVSYKLLGDIYFFKADKDKLAELISKKENINKLSRDTTVNYLDNLLNKLNQ